MERFYDRVRALFGGKLTGQQVDGINRIVDATKGLPLRHRAYILATAHHETARTMQPVRETLALTDASAVARLETAWAKGQLKWVKTPYWKPDASGKSFFGRGYVQLTHRMNYVFAGEKLDIDLAGNPSLALRPDIAAQILVRGMVEGWFTSKKLSDFTAYEDMRRVVNGTDRAADIARLARGYEAALAAIEETPKPAVLPRPVDPRPVDPIPTIKPLPSDTPSVAVGVALTIVAVIIAVIIASNGG